MARSNNPFRGLTTLAAMAKDGLLLATLGSLTALLIAFIYVNTLERIEAAQEAARLQALNEIVPQVKTDEQLEENILMVADPLLGYKEPKPLWRVSVDGRIIAVVMTIIAPDGYTEAIELLLGVNEAGEVLGVRTVRHKETPGLGDKIETRKSDWILGFDGTSLGLPDSERWAVAKDGGAFDQLTGATVTPRAVVAAVKRGLQYVKRNQRTLFAEKQ